MGFVREPTAGGAPRSAALIVAASVALCACVGLVACSKPAPAPEGPKVAAPTDDKVELTASQAKSVTVATIALHTFSPERTAVGSIDFNQDRVVQVFPSYQGKIVSIFAELGGRVEKGKALYTLYSPDLAQAETTLIAAAGVYDLTTQALARDRILHDKHGLSDKDLEQAVSDQMTADGNLRGARAAVLVFGKSNADIDRLIASRRVDPIMVVRSPLTGRVTARNAQVGLLVQPGAASAPFSVADMSTVWMKADVAEADVPLFRRGQVVSVKVDSIPDHDFGGAISILGATVDAATHTEQVVTEVKDPHQELHPGMMATFVIHTGDAKSALALPLDGVVRNGDGSMNVWVTADDRHFTRRTVKLGMQQDGFDQIVDGVQPGERVVTRNAVFLSNMANAASSGDD
jgi:cobalt-zinc-cadmium efflux system membrane fusion protein